MYVLSLLLIVDHRKVTLYSSREITYTIVKLQVVVFCFHMLNPEDITVRCTGQRKLVQT